MVAGIVPVELQGPGLLVEHPPHRADVNLAPEADADDAGHLVEVERRMLGLEIHDEPADAGRESSPPGRLGSEEALHALRLEALHPAPERALGDAGLPGALGHGGAEKHGLAYALVLLLLGPREQRQELPPFVGRFDALPAPSRAHLASPSVSHHHMLSRRGSRMPHAGL